MELDLWIYGFISIYEFMYRKIKIFPPWNKVTASNSTHQTPFLNLSPLEIKQMVQINGFLPRKVPLGDVIWVNGNPRPMPIRRPLVTLPSGRYILTDDGGDGRHAFMRSPLLRQRPW